MSESTDNMAGSQTAGLRTFMQRVRVSSGFLLLPLLFLAARPAAITLLSGAAVSAVGLLIRGLASGYLKKNEELTTSGPYARTRNPLYVGTFVLGAGAAIASASLWFIAAYLIFYLVIYVPVIMAEAETMKKLFKEEYSLYSRHVPLFFPRITAYRAEGSAKNAERRFAFSQYMKHREYRAAIGCAAVFLALMAKMLLTGN
jgi:protein-S-isoprenylcysteine O-methyltransferase Ste14